MKRKTWIIFGSLLVLVLLGITVWYKLMRREVAQPGWIAETKRDLFLYGSVGAEQEAGIPYWIWLAMPRMFPEQMPGNGGYVALGMSWEPGVEMPAGFSKKRVGYVRVAGNCALCHAASYRLGPDDGPEVVPFVPGRGRDVQSLLAFYKNCAEDPQFNAGEILTEVKSATKLSWSDWLLYKFYLIPQTKKKFINQDTVIIDSYLRLHSHDPHSKELLSQPQMRAFTEALKDIQSPVYPLRADATLAAQGKQLFANHCSSCHAADGKQTGTVIPIGELDTDREALKTTNAQGYVARPLNGVWMRGPYLHNGSVPTVRDLLDATRPPSFYSGNNLLDTKKLGFISDLAKPQEKGIHFTRYDATQPGRSNSGHLYGTSLSDREKEAVVEYLKTL